MAHAADSAPLFSTLLVANRGEIAVRVIRACRELGIRSVAVCSDADRDAMHVVLADEVVAIGPAAPHESYLSIARILDAARATGARAIHPGYGFLSESASFAAACAEAGFVFVGPPADAIARMGSKIEARRLMQAHGVPVVPGETPADQSDEAIAAAVLHVGFPALLKPAAGGGGIGMRVITRDGEVHAAIASSRREATAAFGDGTLYVERYVERPRHVEIQVLADHHGHAVHLFERECSLQRRHQKVVEESPSPAVTPALRARMGEAAVAAARASGYRNAGTIEFLLDGSGDEARFYFLEMNTRLQVEHPVTEAVTGVDLVQAQIRVAAGEPLPWTQDHLSQRGHAIECRVYAEDPTEDFLPQAGTLRLYREPQGPGIRVDSGVREGSDVPVHYDPLLAKLIVHAETRPLALARVQDALSRFAIIGVRTNLGYLRALAREPAVAAGEFDTRFLDRETPRISEALEAAAVPSSAIAAAVAHGIGAIAAPTRPADAERATLDPWETLGAWRGTR